MNRSGTRNGLDGCRDPLVTWNGILIDGHNRYEICTRNKIDYKTIESTTLKSREEVMDWMDANQLGRRNLSPNDFALLLGRRYNRMKQKHGGQLPNKGIGQNVQSLPSTAENLAKQHGVDERTVRRSGAFAAAVDIAKEVMPDIRVSDVKRKDILVIAEAVSIAKPEEVKAMVSMDDDKAILARAKEIKEAEAARKRAEHQIKLDKRREAAADTAQNCALTNQD